MVFILRKGPQVLRKDSEIYEKYSTLYAKYKYKKDIFARYFNVVWMTRAWYMGLLLAFVKKAPTVQIIFLVIVDIILLIKILVTKLYESKYDKLMTVI